MSFLDNDRVVWSLIGVLFVVFLMVAYSAVSGPIVDMTLQNPKQACDERFGDKVWNSTYYNTPRNLATVERLYTPPVLFCNTNNAKYIYVCLSGCGTDLGW